MSDGEKTKVVNVVVVDATMPSKYVFRSWREEDLSSIEDESIKTNTTHVKTTSTNLFQDSNEDEPKSDDPITFKGNVNTMSQSTDGGKYYRVRVKVDEIKAADVKVVNKDGKEYKTEAVKNNEYELYVYLDANEATTELVIANKNASKEQIEKETVSCHTVNFESTSKIWLHSARVWNTNSGGALLNASAVTKAEVNANNNHILDIGVKFDELKEITLKDENGTITPTAENGDLWLPVVIRIGNETSGAKVKEAVFASDSDSIVVDRKKATSDNGNELVVWVKSNGNDNQEIPFTLKYNRADEATEELKVTAVLHDASAPKIVSVAPGDDENAKALQNLKVENSNSKTTNRIRTDKITVDTYKYGMKETTRTNYAGEEETGRWYSIKLTFNVPVSSILFNNSGNEGQDVATKENWLPLSNVTGNEVTLWINRDAMDKAGVKSTNSVEQTLCNKWAIEKEGENYKEDGQSNDAKWTVGVTVEENEKSKTALNHELGTPSSRADVFETGVKDAVDDETLSRLNGIDIETKHEDELRKSGSSNYGTFAYTLAESSKITVENDPLNEKGSIATIKLNSANVSDVILTHDGKELEGRWILVHFNVRGEAKTIEDRTDSDAVIIDTNNAGELLQGLKTNDSPKADRIPLWINLDAKEIKAATKYAGDNKTPTPFKVSFGSSTPVEEENYFYIQIEDSCANTEPLPESVKPEAVDIGSLKETDSQLNAELKKLFPNDGSFYDGNPGKAFVKNMEFLKKADISEEIVGDTVYVTIKDDFTKYYNKNNSTGTDFNIAFDLDLSSLDLAKGADVYFYNDGTNKWLTTKFDEYPSVHFGITIQSTDYTNLTTSQQKVSKEYIFSGCKGNDGEDDCTKLNKGYIRYVFTFMQEN